MIQRGKNLPGASLHFFTGIGQMQALANLLEQLQTERLFQFGNLCRYRRLGQMQHACRLRYAETLGNHQKGFQLSEGRLARVEMLSFHSFLTMVSCQIIYFLL